MVIPSAARKLSWAGILSGLFILPWHAEAHTGVATAGGFASGLFHPFSGADHVCAMVAVGLWAAQMGGKAVWRIPLTFTSIMALGGLLGMAALPLPFVEGGIVLSLLVLGVLIAAAMRLPLSASTAVVGVFALFHGYAHGMEMPPDVTGLAYASGFLLATAVLNVTGMAMGRYARHADMAQALRYAGGMVAACGVYLWLAA